MGLADSPSGVDETAAGTAAGILPECCIIQLPFRAWLLLVRMGAYLSEPVLEKHSEDGQNESLGYGSSSMQGWRVSQEVHLPAPSPQLSVLLPSTV